MKIRIPFAIASIALFFWSCDEPTPYENNSFIYNPFSIVEDTLHNVTAIESGESDIEWNSHFRAWVGETQYYKSGFTFEFVFSDTSLDIAGVDSIQLNLNHVITYPEAGEDTLGSSTSSFGFYETMDQSIDIVNSAYGIFLGNDSMSISNGSENWTYTLPVGVIAEGDTIVSLGIFPTETNYLSSVYGGGSVSRPTLKFFYHEQDTAGLDSATNIPFQADTLFMYFAEKPSAFDRGQFNYISQLKRDSVILTLNLNDFDVAGDTLQHIISSKIFPAIDDFASALYKPDSVYRFSMIVEEPVSGLSATIEYAGGAYNSNQVNGLIQPAIDEHRDELNLILKATNAGYNPGFIAISKDLTESSLYVKSSLAVRP